MNYPQEKYDEVRAATGWNMSNEAIDRILSIFATVPQLTREQWKEAWKIYRCENDLRGAINTFLAKQGPVVAAKPADGMVSLEDVEKAVFDRLCETSMKAGEISKIMDNIHDRLAKPEPTVTLVDAAEGRTLEVPASSVYKMEYPEAITYTRDPWTGKDMCNLCGVYVVDKVTHAAFHGRMEGK